MKIKEIINALGTDVSIEEIKEHLAPTPGAIDVSIDVPYGISLVLSMEDAATLVSIFSRAKHRKQVKWGWNVIGDTTQEVSLTFKTLSQETVAIETMRHVLQMEPPKND